MLLKLLNKLRNFRLFGLLSLSDLYTIAAYGLLAVWAILNDVTEIVYMLAGLVPITMALGYFIHRSAEQLIAAYRDLEVTRRERRHALAEYLHLIASQVESGYPLTLEDATAIRGIANGLEYDKETKKAEEKPDDQPERGSAASDAGAPESEGLPPQA